MKTLILAGGSGTRLFPLSREQFPKQFIKLFDGISLFQKTVLRSLIFSSPDEISIVTNTDHAFIVSDQLAQIDCRCRVLVEPEGKNTLPAIYYGVKTIVEEQGHDTIAVLPSDQLVEADDAYRRAFLAGESLAADHLVVFGILPTTPHTGYGYIKPGDPLSGGHRVGAFCEKPDSRTAEGYVRDGYLWNSGMFLFNSELFMEESARHAPDVARAFNLPVEEAFKTTPRISIDYGIMEKTDHAAVVPFSSPWNDLGTFDALYSAFPKNGNANAVRGEHIGIDSHHNLIIGSRLIATAGVSNLAIIETKDVVLVAARDHAQQVGEITKMLKDAGDDRALHHTQVHRPWGSYTTLEEGGRTGVKERDRAGNRLDNTAGDKEGNNEKEGKTESTTKSSTEEATGGGTYKIKRVSVPPGRRLSLQMHHHRNEHWVVVTGCAEVMVGEKTFLLKNGESTYVPAGTVHRLANPGLLPLELIEVQIGEYTGEDDIVRFEDDFDRV